jgi:hypothetical protein
MENRGLKTAPKWVWGETQRDCHLSGELREASGEVWGGKVGVAFEVLTEKELKLVCLLEEAAEALDDAHEEWMENQLCQTNGK